MNKLQRFKEGIKNLTPLQQLVSQIHGTIGMMFGLIFAWVIMHMRGMWFFGFVMFFALFLQGITLIGLYQKKRGLIAIGGFEVNPVEEVKDDEEE